MSVKSIIKFIWPVIVGPMILCIAFVVGTIIEWTKPETKGIRDVLVMLFDEALKFINDIQLQFG